MNKIIATSRLSDDVYRFEIEAPHIAREREPGQFVIVQIDTEFGERIPLTIADADPVRGSIVIIFQAVGASTHRLASKVPGDSIAAVLGPLGRPTHIKAYGTVVCVGGGVGIAPLHPIVEGMRAAGNRIVTILGARTSSLLFMLDEMRALSDEFILVTDDGSAGKKALVTEPLKEICGRDPKPDLAVAIGPPVMMKFCAEATRPFGVPTMVSLNTIMIDGTGMCGGCRVTVGGETKFVCVDGPEFDGHKVDFEGMMTRMRTYKSIEDEAHHLCHLELEGKAGKA